MNRSSILRGAVIAAHGLVGWAVCGSIIGIGRQVASMDATLIAHAIAVPVVFSALSVNYFRRFGYTSPRTTAAIFTAVPMAMDALVVAPFGEHSYAMFASPLGSWIPFALIFLATYATGSLVARPGRAATA